jgi:predicted ATPase/transcriptional regulator with XRE-family HTH domain
MEEINTFGLWVRQRRRALDLTQQELAMRVGCSVVTIRKIEAEERRPSRQIAELLADSLEISLADRPRFLKFARTGYSAELALGPAAVRAQEPQPAPALKPQIHPIPPPVQPEPPVEREVGRTVRGQNLPAQQTPFIGREHELLEISRLLESPDCRLLTLIGPAGIGKTRLALQAAGELARRSPAPFPDGVFFISFASTEDPAFFIPVLADGFGLTFHSSSDQRTQLLSFLEKKKILLILDNLEHLLGSALFGAPASGGESELLVDILQGAPEVKQLVTSRERLNLRGEWLLDIHSLPFPEDGQEGSFERFSSVALFLQIARRVSPGFNLTADEKPWVARICQLVEGIPLGIEMAASWVRVLSCQEIAQEIEHSLDFLATSLRDVPERHRSMRAAFDYSWKLLSEEERRVFRGLSVFRGGFTRAAASQVAGASLFSLSALVDKSLLCHAENGHYSFHELLKQYAAAKLEETPEEKERALGMHCDYFMDLLGQQDILLRTAQQPGALLTLSGEIDNLRAAWQRAVAIRCWPAIRKAARAFCYYFELTGLTREGSELFDAAAASLPGPSGMGEDETGAFGAVIACQGFFRYRLGRYRQAEKLLQRALEILGGPQAALEYGDALTFLGIVLEQLGEYGPAGELLTEGIAHSRRMGSLWNTAVCQVVLGTVEQRQGDYPAAEKTLGQALDLLRDGGDPHVTVWGLQVMSFVCTVRQEYSAAQDLLRESLKISYELKDRWGTATAQHSLGQVLFRMGQYHQARYHLQDSLELYQEIGDRWGQTQTLISLGDTDCALSDCAEAWSHYREALRNAVELQTLPLAMDALVRLAGEMRREGDERRASVVLYLVLHHPATRQETRLQAGDLLARLASRPDEPADSNFPPAPARLETLIREILEEN